MTATKTEGTFEGFCILEIMGHRKLGGYLREATIASASYIRLDSFNEAGEVVATQFYNPSSVYCITPTTQEIAIAFGLRNQPAPVQKWELPKLSEPIQIAEDNDYSDFDDDDYQP